MKWIARLVNFFSTSHQRKLLLLVTVVVILVMSAFGAYLVNNQDQIKSDNQIWLLVVVIIVVLTFFLIVSLSFLEARLVTRPLRELTDLTSRISAGDYTGRTNLISRDEIGMLASAFNNMTNQLQQTLEDLEQRVQDRTTEIEQKSILLENRAIQLQAIADISRDLAAINDFDELLPAIVRLIAERFGLYHVGLFLMNPAKDTLILSAASGAGSQSLLEKNFSLPVEPSSMSGYAASRGRPRVTQDVGQDSTYLVQADLPETKSEAAMPLLAGTETIGVLDLQSINSNTFGEEDLSFLSTLANQVALSILNARSVGATRQALLESEKVYEQYVQQGWKRISRETPNQGYRYSQAGITPIKLTTATTEITSAPEAATASLPERATVLSIPIKLRGQTIGTMEILSTELVRTLDSDEMAMIQATAERAALALETARLLEDSQRRASRERAIGEISTSISSAVDIDTILRTTVDELGKKLKNAEVSIHVGNEQETL